MKNSAIEWCDHTFNPVRGCTKVSPGCARFSRMKRTAFNFHLRLALDAIEEIEACLRTHALLGEIAFLNDAKKWTRCARTNLRLARRALRPTRPCPR